MTTAAERLPSQEAPFSQQSYTAERIAHWDALAAAPHERFWTRAYRRRLQQVYQHVIAPGQRVLEIGCGRGDLLASLRPAVGIGIDFSPRMIEHAKRCHPHLTFLTADAHRLPILKPFDVVVLSDLVNDLWDVQEALVQVRRVLVPRGRVMLNHYSRLWQLPLSLVRALRLVDPCLPQSWLATEDVANLLHLTDFEMVRTWQEVLCPVNLPGIAPPFNRYLCKFWPFRHLALANFAIARPAPKTTVAAPKVSVIVPARNESGNIAAIFERTPHMGRETELIFVEGHSTDDTPARIESEMHVHSEIRSNIFRQMGKGKGGAVRLGFAKATGDVLMILDADLTVPPEDLARFYEALVQGKGDFINGVRLVYPMERQAMRFLNLLGNKFFSLAFSWLLGQPIKDTLCGTKVLWKQDYERIAANRRYFGDFDPFGDFDLLFGGAKQTLKIVDLPIRYRERKYGTTNIQRWRHGWLLLRMVMFAARKLKFV
jgi:SAM-dependent methyltransferase